MKFIIVLLLILILSVAAIAQTSTSKGTLKVTIENIQSSNGAIRIAIYNEEENFLKPEIFDGKSLETNGKKKQHTTFHIPFGHYAISVFHDENNNEELDQNSIGMPSEPYGFSNNARGNFGPPSYKDALFNFTNSNQQIRIKLK